MAKLETIAGSETSINDDNTQESTKKKVLTQQEIAELTKPDKKPENFWSSEKEEMRLDIERQKSLIESITNEKQKNNERIKLAQMERQYKERYENQEQESSVLTPEETKDKEDQEEQTTAKTAAVKKLKTKSKPVSVPTPKQPEQAEQIPPEIQELRDTRSAFVTAQNHTKKLSGDIIKDAIINQALEDAEKRYNEAKRVIYQALCDEAETQLREGGVEEANLENTLKAYKNKILIEGAAEEHKELAQQRALQYEQQKKEKGWFRLPTSWQEFKQEVPHFTNAINWYNSKPQWAKTAMGTGLLLAASGFTAGASMAGAGTLLTSKAAWLFGGVGIRKIAGDMMTAIPSPSEKKDGELNKFLSFAATPGFKTFSKYAMYGAGRGITMFAAAEIGRGAGFVADKIFGLTKEVEQLKAEKQSIIESAAGGEITAEQLKTIEDLTAQIESKEMKKALFRGSVSIGSTVGASMGLSMATGYIENKYADQAGKAREFVTGEGQEHKINGIDYTKYNAKKMHEMIHDRMTAPKNDWTEEEKLKYGIGTKTVDAQAMSPQELKTLQQQLEEQHKIVSQSVGRLGIEDAMKDYYMGVDEAHARQFGYAGDYNDKVALGKWADGQAHNNFIESQGRAGVDEWHWVAEGGKVKLDAETGKIASLDDLHKIAAPVVRQPFGGVGGEGVKLSTDKFGFGADKELAANLEKAPSVSEMITTNERTVYAPEPEDIHHANILHKGEPTLEPEQSSFAKDEMLRGSSEQAPLTPAGSSNFEKGYPQTETTRLAPPPEITTEHRVSMTKLKDFIGTMRGAHGGGDPTTIDKNYMASLINRGYTPAEIHNAAKEVGIDLDQKKLENAIQMAKVDINDLTAKHDKAIGEIKDYLSSIRKAHEQDFEGNFTPAQKEILDTANSGHWWNIGRQSKAAEQILAKVATGKVSENDLEGLYSQLTRKQIELHDTLGNASVDIKTTEKLHNAAWNFLEKDLVEKVQGKIRGRSTDTIVNDLIKNRIKDVQPDQEIIRVTPTTTKTEAVMPDNRENPIITPKENISPTQTQTVKETPINITEKHAEALTLASLLKDGKISGAKDFEDLHKLVKAGAFGSSQMVDLTRRGQITERDFAQYYAEHVNIDTEEKGKRLIEGLTKSFNQAKQDFIAKNMVERMFANMFTQIRAENGTGTAPALIKTLLEKHLSENK